MGSHEQRLIDEGYAALRAGDSSTARRLFESASLDGDRGATLEGLARAGYLDHDYLPAIQLWGSAYEAYRREADGVAAIRVARTLAYMHLSIVGDRAVMQGWFARAVSLLAKEGPCPETGWVSLNKGMFESDRVLKEQHYREALTHARDSGDSSLEFATLAYLGASLVHNDRVDEGMLLLDEALAAVAGRDVDDFTVVEEIFCQLFAGAASTCTMSIAPINGFGSARTSPPAESCRRWRRSVVRTTAVCDGRRPLGRGRRRLSDARTILGSRTQLAAARCSDARLAELRVRQGRLRKQNSSSIGLDGVVEAQSLPLAASTPPAAG